MWTSEDIFEANAAKPDQAKSRLEWLLDLGQADPSILADVANEIEGREVYWVAAFFQLPYSLNTEATWYRVYNQRPFADVAFIRSHLVMTEAGKFRLSRGHSSDAFHVTQTVVLYPVRPA